MAKSTKRAAIVADIIRLAEPHFYDSGFNKVLDPKQGIFGPKRKLRVFREGEGGVAFEGYVLTEMLALSEDGPITDAAGGGCMVTSFDELPVEDLTLLRAWAERAFAPPSAAAPL